jgi:hypothetical protein
MSKTAWQIFFTFFLHLLVYDRVRHLFGGV